MVDRHFFISKLIWWLEKEKCQECGKCEMMRFFAYVRTTHEEPWGRWGEEGKPSRDPRARTEIRPRTAANYFRWLRTFFAFSLGDGVLDASPRRTLKPLVHRDDQIKPFTAKQIDALPSAAKRGSNAARDDASCTSFSTMTPTSGRSIAGWTDPVTKHANKKAPWL